MKRFIIFLLLIFCVGLFINNRTYALSDLSETYTDGSVHAICGSGPGWNNFPSCDGYNYLIIESQGMSSTEELQFNSSVNFGTLRLGSSNLFVIHRTFVTGDYVRFNLQNYSTGSYKVTLSENMPGSSCPEPEPPEPCPDPEENSQFINVVIDAFWKYHKVFAGAVVGIIVIFMVYRVIKGIMR